MAPPGWAQPRLYRFNQWCISCNFHPVALQYSALLLQFLAMLLEMVFPVLTFALVTAVELPLGEMVGDWIMAGGGWSLFKRIIEKREDQIIVPAQLL